MSLLRDAKRYLLRPAVKAAAGVSVRYHSNVTGLVYTVTATMANSVAEAETTEGIQFTEQLKDWKIDTADLPVMPQAKDRIEVIGQLGVAVQWYQVLSEGGARAVEPGDNHEDWWLIHSKNIPAPEAANAVYGNAAGDAYGNAAGDAYGSANR